jgi:CHAD domain-containing protein
MSKPRKFPELNPDEPVVQSLKKALFYWIQKGLSHNAAVIEEKNTEAVHDMRTAALRIRTLLKLHKEHLPKKGFQERRRDLKRLIDVMGPVREMEVSQQELAKLAQNALQKDRIALNWLIAQQENQRVVFCTAMKKEIRAMQGSGFWKELAQFVEDLPLTKRKADISAEAITLRQSGRDVIPPLLASFLAEIELTCENENHPEILHAMRLQGKRLRYAMEMYLPAYGSSFVQHFDSVKDVLSAMGRIHDLDVNLPVLKRHSQQIVYFNSITKARASRVATAGFNKLIQQLESERHEHFLCLCLVLSRWKSGAFRRGFLNSLSSEN